jgi:putative Holliday junction resolvase
MKFLGIDYGTKRIGLALSDDNGKLAFPKEVVLNDLKLLGKIKKILLEEKIDEIIIGESINFSGKPNLLSSKIENFISKLEENFKKPIRRQKEFLTSVEARKSINPKKSLKQKQSHNRLKNKKTGYIDDSAAVFILQRYLDKINTRY